MIVLGGRITILRYLTFLHASEDELVSIDTITDARAVIIATWFSDAGTSKENPEIHSEEFNSETWAPVAPNMWLATPLKK